MFLKVETIVAQIMLHFDRITLCNMRSLWYFVYTGSKVFIPRHTWYSWWHHLRLKYCC